MKRLIFISGPMGVGKTTVSTLLYRRLEDSVFLDGDWCWMMHPFTVTDETRAMVLDNITHLLNNFLACSQYQNIIFCWVMDSQDILDSIRTRLALEHCAVFSFTLTASPDALEKRIAADIARKLRQPGDAARSIARLPHYDTMDTIKVDVSSCKPEEAVDAIVQYLH